MTATAPLLDRCPACGQQSESDSSCTRCGASLWVDLWLDGPAPDRRTCFLAARELAALGLPGGGFARLKESLAVTGEPFAVAVPRREARAALDALCRRGLGATARASARTAPRRSRARVAMLAGAAALVLVAAGALVRMRQGPGEPPALAHAAASALVADERGPLAPPVAAAGPPPENRLTTQDLTTLAIDSVAEVSCGAQGGTAFFVTPEHAAT